MHYWADLQSVDGIRCYDNIAPNAKCQRVLVLGHVPGCAYQIKSNQIYLPTQNMKEKKTDKKPEVKQNEKNNDKLEC